MPGIRDNQEPGVQGNLCDRYILSCQNVVHLSKNDLFIT